MQACHHACVQTTARALSKVAVHPHQRCPLTSPLPPARPRAGLSGAWMLQKAMSVPADAPDYDPAFINRLLAANFKAG